MLSDWRVLLFQALGGGMLPFLWTLEFEAVEKGEMLPVFQILSFEAVDKGGMLSVFQIPFSRMLWGNCCPLLFFEVFCFGRL